jgi:hypothetical protein
MRFRLVFSGAIPPGQRNPEKKQSDPLAVQKQRIRRDFHVQLRELWQQTRVLREKRMHPAHFAGLGILEGNDAPVEWASDQFDQGQQYPLVQLVQHAHREHGYEWVPLLRRAYAVDCELDIIFLRRGHPDGGPIENGDLDNRIKTLIDCLKMPRSTNELVGDDAFPRPGETPFHVLMEDDAIVSRLNVESDRLYYPKVHFPKSTERAALRVEDDRLVSVLITVTVKPYYPSIFNMMWG